MPADFNANNQSAKSEEAKIEYVCPNCGTTSDKKGECPECGEELKKVCDCGSGLPAKECCEAGFDDEDQDEEDNEVEDPWDDD